MRFSWFLASVLTLAGDAVSQTLNAIPDGRRGSPGDFLETQMQSDGKLLFTFWTTGGGGHVCRLHGLAVPTASGVFVFREAGSKCVFHLFAESDALRTEDVGEQCREESCGPRNVFGSMRWPLNQTLPLTDEIRPTW